MGGGSPAVGTEGRDACARGSTAPAGADGWELEDGPGTELYGGTAAGEGAQGGDHDQMTFRVRGRVDARPRWVVAITR